MCKVPGIINDRNGIFKKGRELIARCKNVGVGIGHEHSAVEQGDADVDFGRE